METPPPTRPQALELFKEFNKTDKALRHALAVEAVMRHFAAKKGPDAQAAAAGMAMPAWVEKWGVIGLIHDLDYEQFPAEHCTKTAEILRSRGWPEDYVRSVVSHGWGMCSDVQPQSEMEKVLFAADELTGLAAACALVRPSKSLADLEARSVKKKWKEKGFAAGVDRAVIEKGAAMLGVELPAFIEEVIAAMRPVAAELGLAGQTKT
jgi:predicted hydrolase (HD superfamily)